MRERAVTRMLSQLMKVVTVFPGLHGDIASGLFLPIPPPE